MCRACCFCFNDTATTEIYTLSLHDALPIFVRVAQEALADADALLLEDYNKGALAPPLIAAVMRSEEHTSELQSRQYLVCRLLLEKKKKFPSIAHEGRRFTPSVDTSSATTAP